MRGLLCVLLTKKETMSSLTSCRETESREICFYYLKNLTGIYPRAILIHLTAIRVAPFRWDWEQHQMQANQIKDDHHLTCKPVFENN